MRIDRTLETSKSAEHPSHIHSIEYETEITAVLEHLHSNLGNLTSSNGVSSFLYVSESCRMAVDIDGNLKDHTFGRVEKLLEAFGRQLDGLQGGEAFGNSNPWLPLLADEPPSDSSDGEARSNEPLCERHPFETMITFGQGASTLDSAAALAWIDVLTSLVVCADLAEQSFLEHQLGSQGEFSNPLFSSSDLLQILGCAPSTIDYYSKKAAGYNAALKESVASAMIATADGKTLAPLALHVANMALVQDNPLEARQRIKLKLLGGEYGKFSREYTKIALKAIDRHAEGEVLELKGKDDVPNWLYAGLPEDLKVGLCK